ncbi:MAG: hypothetical protein EXR72_05400 [Myxococcales bacterium]|nr:hypothetical protein [Myxococcales bacterium]
MKVLDAENPTTDEVISAHRTIAAVADEYAAIVTEIPESQRGHVERTTGRRVTDLRRQASKLPQKSAGQSVANASDVPAGGGWPFLLQRTPSKSIEPRRDAVNIKRGETPHLRVGGEIEAWCGTCAGLTEHHIFALVDGKPKQVICQGCNARHGFRVTPARSKDSPIVAATTAATYKPSRQEMEARKKEEERFALQKELAEATVVRPFVVRERYKAGEIVQHAEHGRGKIENVLRGSILVRFRTGLKSLSIM